MSIEENNKALEALLKDETLEEENSTKEEINNEVKNKEVDNDIKADDAQNEQEVEDEKDVEDEGEQDEQEEEAEENNIDKEEELKLLRQLSGHTKEQKEFILSIKDPELRAKAINAGNRNRADLDRIRLEYGQLKKEYASNQELLELYKSNPKEAINYIAKKANLDLKTAVDNDEDEYLTDQELSQKNKIRELEATVNKLTRSEQEKQIVEAQKEIYNFANSKDEEGNLKYPHFERVRQNMQYFFTMPNADPDLTLEQAYNKAILLDDELREERERELLLSAELSKKKKLEKAKSLKKYSSSSNRIDTVLLSPKEANKQALSKLFS